MRCRCFGFGTPWRVGWSTRASTNGVRATCHWPGSRCVWHRVGCLWARHEGTTVGSVTVVWADPFIWGDRAERAGYVHMLMVGRAYAHVGLGRGLLDWAERKITRTGRQRARLDCVRNNAVLRAYYEAAGYVVVGYRDSKAGSRVWPSTRSSSSASCRGGEAP